MDSNLSPRADSDSESLFSAYSICFITLSFNPLWPSAQCQSPLLSLSPAPSLLPPALTHAMILPAQYIMCALTVEGSTFAFAARSLQGGAWGSPLRLVFPMGPSQLSCPFMGLLPHLVMGMGLPALQLSSTSIMLLGVRHS